MAKRVLAAAVLAGAVLAIAPMAGIAEPTPESVVALEQVEKAPGFLEKTRAVLGGAKEQTVAVIKKMRNIDERLRKKDEEIAFLKKRLMDMERMSDEKRYVRGVELERAKNCVTIFHNFLEQQVEGK